MPEINLRLAREGLDVLPNIQSPDFSPLHQNARVTRESGEAVARAGQQIGDGLVKLGMKWSQDEKNRRDDDMMAAWNSENTRRLYGHKDADGNDAPGLLMSVGKDATGAAERYTEGMREFTDTLTRDLSATDRKAFNNRVNGALNNNYARLQAHSFGEFQRVRGEEVEANTAVALLAGNKAGVEIMAFADAEYKDSMEKVEADAAEMLKLGMSKEQVEYYVASAEVGNHNIRAAKFARAFTARLDHIQNAAAFHLQRMKELGKPDVYIRLSSARLMQQAGAEYLAQMVDAGFEDDVNDILEKDGGREYGLYDPDAAKGVKRYLEQAVTRRNALEKQARLADAEAVKAELFEFKKYLAEQERLDYPNPVAVMDEAQEKLANNPDEQKQVYKDMNGLLKKRLEFEKANLTEAQKQQMESASRVVYRGLMLSQDPDGNPITTAEARKRADNSYFHRDMTEAHHKEILKALDTLETDRANEFMALLGRDVFKDISQYIQAAGDPRRGIELREKSGKTYASKAFSRPWFDEHNPNTWRPSGQYYDDVTFAHVEKIVAAQIQRMLDDPEWTPSRSAAYIKNFIQNEPSFVRYRNLSIDRAIQKFSLEAAARPFARDE